MKLLLIIPALSIAPQAFAQAVINPTNTQIADTIILQNTNVYYSPMAPPADTDSRTLLSNLSESYRSPDGRYPSWPHYQPFTHGESLLGWTPDSGSAPLGFFARWQRFFTAKRRSDGAASDIIAKASEGDSVWVSKNEDVDFRASGTIWLDNGFIADSGCFFEAYQEPKWDTAVFADEFDDTASLHTKWHVFHGTGGNWYGQGAACTSEKNVRDTLDPEAQDGHALDLFTYETAPDLCACEVLTGGSDSLNCSYFPVDSARYIFVTGMMRSCPWPFKDMGNTPLVSAYDHAPYGKYECREKIPHFMHHPLFWGGGYTGAFEYDINEADWHGEMDRFSPSFSHQFEYGPNKGVFRHIGDTVIFISHDPEWCWSNKVQGIVVQNIAYQVQWFGHGFDTVCIDRANFTGMMGCPASIQALANASVADTITFFYTIDYGGERADTIPWRVDTNASGEWKILSFPGYHVNRHGDTLRFSKFNQPSAITLQDSIDFHLNKYYHTRACHWDHAVNTPVDSGKLVLDNPLSSGCIHSNVESFSFVAVDQYSGAEYPTAFYPFNGNDSTGGYEYHRFTMELLPNEAIYLMDSNVVARFPDHLVPPTSRYSDWVSKLGRTVEDIRGLATDIDIDHSDSLGQNDTIDRVEDGYTYYKTLTSTERHYFEHAAAASSWPGFADVWVDGKKYRAAHHIVDYVKIWDVPKDQKIMDYPR